MKFRRIPLIALWLSGLVLLWLLVLLRLAREWSVSETFYFAWAVPILVLLLIYRRGEDLPRLARPDSKRRFLVITGVCSCAAFLLPLRILSEANPAWRMVHWLLVLTACAITLLVAYEFGGRHWVSRFGTPFLLMLVAIPWPSQLEALVVQFLTHTNAHASVNVLNLVGIPVVLNGENLLQFANGSLRIDDACSGIRSLYLAIALGFFWGALYHLHLVRRAILVLAAVAVALIANLCRNLILGVICCKAGQETMEAWHDLVGIGAQLVFLAGLWGLVVAMNRRRPASKVRATAIPRAYVAPQGRFVVLATLVGIAWLGALEVLNEWWYRSRSEPAQARAAWEVSMPSDTGFREYAMSPRSKSILRPDEHRGFVWQTAEIGSGLFFYLSWEPGSNAAQHAQVHRPEICLPAAGFRQVTAPVDVPLKVADRPFVFRGYEFDHRGERVFVFHGIWDDLAVPSTSESEALAENWSPASRLRAAWFGRRQSGQRVLEAAFWGASDLNVASARFQRLLDEAIESTPEEPSTLALR